MAKNWHEKHQDTLSRSDKIADAITAFAGTMHFIYVHFIWWAFWFIINANFLHVAFDKYPYSLLTMILSLEAILLATLIMISQNRQSARDKIQAEHQYEHQESTLKHNTEITQEIHAIVSRLSKESTAVQDLIEQKTDHLEKLVEEAIRPSTKVAIKTKLKK